MPSNEDKKNSKFKDVIKDENELTEDENELTEDEIDQVVGKLNEEEFRKMQEIRRDFNNSQDDYLGR